MNVVYLEHRRPPFRTPEQVEQDKAEHERIRLSARAVAYTARQRALCLKRMVPWADAKAIVPIYREAQRLTRRTGIPHDVDHIIPLLGERVSGLHVESNLCVLPRMENIRKSNCYMMGGEGLEPPTPAM